MTPLPPPLGGGELVAWRLNVARYATTWDSGEGAYLAGGRWNSVGTRAVYCSIDPATAILEVAVHKGFKVLDTLAHVLTAATISDAADVHVVWPEAVPDPSWLRPGIPSAGQQAFGEAVLAAHKVVLLPSVVSVHSWNVVFIAANAARAYRFRSSEQFALDPRLHPPEGR